MLRTLPYWLSTATITNKRRDSVGVPDYKSIPLYAKEHSSITLVGFSGYARSGKDSAAGSLVATRGFTKKSFAEQLKAAVYALDPLVKHRRFWNTKFHFATTRLSSLVDSRGWEGAKDEASGEVRRLLQFMGTEVGRKLFGEDFWVQQALNGYTAKDKVVFTDVRFPNEAKAIKDLGGVVLRVTRKGIHAVSDHPSEISLDHWKFDGEIRNDGSIEELHDAVASWLYTLSTL